MDSSEKIQRLSPSFFVVFVTFVVATPRDAVNGYVSSDFKPIVYATRIG